jgi:hypothetical protein
MVAMNTRFTAIVTVALSVESEDQLDANNVAVAAIRQAIRAAATDNVNEITLDGTHRTVQVRGVAEINSALRAGGLRFNTQEM